METASSLFSFFGFLVYDIGNDIYRIWCLFGFTLVHFLFVFAFGGVNIDDRKIYHFVKYFSLCRKSRNFYEKVFRCDQVNTEIDFNIK